MGPFENNQNVVGFHISMPKDVYYYIIYGYNSYFRKTNGLRPVHGKTWALFTNCLNLVRSHMRKIVCHTELTNEEGKTAKD